MIEPDGQLVRSMVRGDHRAASELWARLGPRLIGLARAMMGIGREGDDAEAQDIVQQVFVRLVALRFEQANQITDLWSYLAAAVRNTVANQARSDARRQQRERADRPTGTPWDGGDGELLEAVAAISPDDRELIALKHFAGLTFDQMSAVLEQPRGTVVARYRSAIERLAAQLDHPRHGQASREASHV